ncbi:TPA: hypothetical protein ACKE1S_000724 [Citrobacter farmeri]
MKIILMVIVGAFLFVAGFLCGGLNYDWTNKEYSSTVAFWAMIGGWASSVLTFAAVAISLYMAYQARQNDVEKIILKTKSPKKSPFGDSWDVTIDIINARAIHTKIESVYITIDSTKHLIVNHLIEGQVFPLQLSYKGEVVKVSFKIDGGNLWWPIFCEVDKYVELNFIKGFFIFQTPVAEHKIPITKDILILIKDRFNHYKEQNL